MARPGRIVLRKHSPSRKPLQALQLGSQLQHRTRKPELRLDQKGTDEGDERQKKNDPQGKGRPLDAGPSATAGIVKDEGLIFTIRSWLGHFLGWKAMLRRHRLKRKGDESTWPSKLYSGTGARIRLNRAPEGIQKVTRPGLCRSQLFLRET